MFKIFSLNKVFIEPMHETKNSKLEEELNYISKQVQYFGGYKNRLLYLFGSNERGSLFLTISKEHLSFSLPPSQPFF